MNDEFGSKEKNMRMKLFMSMAGVALAAAVFANSQTRDCSMIVYRGQLNLLDGTPAEHDATYVKKMHFRVYDGSDSTQPLWQTGSEGLNVTVNADGSFVAAFGDETLAGLIATGTVTHVGVAIGQNASLAVELKPRRELRSVAAVNRALTAEAAAVDARVGNLASDNALSADKMTVANLEVNGLVDAPGARKVKVSPLVIGEGERTRLLRGNGVKVFAEKRPQEWTISSAVVRGQILLENAPADGIALIASRATYTRALRCPAVVQYCRKGESVRAPTSDEGGMKVLFFPFIGKEGE